jgi:UDP-N-acetylglucosamine--N-acetylmuramyl-(pentapeptide) pyrophosphoryl-undecaprenol N-acetylglucosamine transferase
VKDHRPWFVFAGGGTGGHLFPALSVVELLKDRQVPIDVSFFCTERAIDRDVLGRVGIEAIALRVQPFPTRPWRWPMFLWRWRESVSACRRAFRSRRPAVVVGAGGYASGPPVAAALRMGIPTYLLNPDAVPGRANRHLGRRRDLGGIFAQWSVTRDHFPATARVLAAGCPVRGAFRAIVADAADASRARQMVAEFRRSFDLLPERPTLLVTGASQGARTINEAFMELAALIGSAGWQVLHLTGQGDRDRVAQAYGAAQVPAAVLAFTDRMPEAMFASDLIVSRAGASTLAEILALGKPSILLPYPYHRDRHQWHNAEVLVDAGAAVLVDDLKDASANAGQLRPVLADILGNSARRAEMASSACRLGKPGAAAEIAERLCEAAEAGY